MIACAEPLKNKRLRFSLTQPGVARCRRLAIGSLLAAIVVLASLSQPVPAGAAGDGEAEPNAEAGADGSAASAAADSVASLRQLHDRLLRAVAAERWDRAEATLERIDEQLPADHSLHARLAGWYALKRGRDERAIRAFERVLASEPGDENAALNLAFIHYRAERFGAARRVLERALDHAPGSKALSQARDRLPRRGR